MKAKISKLIWGDVVNISISRFRFSEDSILKIINLFEYENVIIEIGDVEKSSSLYQIVQMLSLKYATPLCDNFPYTDVVLMVNACNLKEIIHHFFISKCNSFSLESVIHHDGWEQHLNRSIHEQLLIKRKIITLSIVAVINEFQVDISFHKDTYDAKQILVRVKECLCV